jgi:hypothetical protein
LPQDQPGWIAETLEKKEYQDHYPQHYKNAVDQFPCDVLYQLR